MCRQIRGILIIVAAVMLLASFCACGKTEEPDGTQSNEKLSELGNVFLSDLQRKILPNRETPESLPDHGYVLVKDNMTYGIDSLMEFFVAYQGKNDGEVTLIFTGSSFVVVRMVFEDDAGYRLRYEYDKRKSKDISITGELVDSIDLQYQDSPPKWELKLFSGKKQTAVFEFRNPV